MEGSRHAGEVVLPSTADPRAPSPSSCAGPGDYATALIRWAAENGHARVLDQLLNQGQVMGYCGWKTPLQLAAQRGQLLVAELLLRRGACGVDATDICYGRTALSFAAEEGHKDMADLLLGFGAKVDATSRCGETALSWAADCGHLAVVELLLEHGAQVEPEDTYLARRPLSLAAAKGHLDIVKLLMRKGARAATRDRYDDMTALHWAAYSGQAPVLRFLLKEHGGENFEIDGWAKHRATPLFLASEGGHTDVVELLLRNGADPDGAAARKDSSWSFHPAYSMMVDVPSPCGAAAARGFSGTVALLLDAGANIESHNGSYGQTPLSLAAANGHVETVKLLLARGADVHAEDSRGRTALWWATKNRHEDVAAILPKSSAETPKSDDKRIDAATAPAATKAADNTASDLCGVCSGLDFARYFSEAVDQNPATNDPVAGPQAVPLGSLAELDERSKSCGFCHLVVEALTNSLVKVGYRKI